MIMMIIDVGTSADIDHVIGVAVTIHTEQTNLMAWPLGMQGKEETQTAQLVGREDSGRLVLDGGQERTVFRLSIAMARLEADFSYEAGDSLPLGTISVQVCPASQYSLATAAIENMILGGLKVSPVYRVFRCWSHAVFFR